MQPWWAWDYFQKYYNSYQPQTFERYCRFCLHILDQPVIHIWRITLLSTMSWFDIKIKSQKHTYTHTILTRIHKSLLHFYQPQEEYEIHQIQEGEHKRSSWTSNTQIVQKHRRLQDSHTLYVWGPRCVHLWGLRSRRKGSVLINTSAVHYGKMSFIAYEIYHCKAAAHHRLLLKLLPHNSSDSSPELTYRHNTQLFRCLASIFNCTGSNKSLKWISTTTEKCVCIGIWEQYFSLFVFKHSVISNKSLSVCV